MHGRQTFLVGDEKNKTTCARSREAQQQSARAKRPTRTGELPDLPLGPEEKDPQFCPGSSSCCRAACRAFSSAAAAAFSRRLTEEFPRAGKPIEDAGNAGGVEEGEGRGERERSEGGERKSPAQGWRGGTARRPVRFGVVTTLPRNETSGCRMSEQEYRSHACQGSSPATMRAAALPKESGSTARPLEEAARTPSPPWGWRARGLAPGHLRGVVASAAVESVCAEEEELGEDRGWEGFDGRGVLSCSSGRRRRQLGRAGKISQAHQRLLSGGRRTPAPTRPCSADLSLRGTSTLSHVHFPLPPSPRWQTRRAERTAAPVAIRGCVRRPASRLEPPGRCGGKGALAHIGSLDLHRDPLTLLPVAGVPVFHAVPIITVEERSASPARKKRQLLCSSHKTG